MASANGTWCVVFDCQGKGIQWRDSPGLHTEIKRMVPTKMTVPTSGSLLEWRKSLSRASWWLFFG